MGDPSIASMSDSPIASLPVAWSASSPTRSRRGERGQGLTEYGLILMLIAIVALVALQVLGNTTADPLYTNIANGLRTATGG